MIPSRKTPSPNAGGCDFGARDENGRESADVWTPEALPSVIVLTKIPDGFADARYRLPGGLLDQSVAAGGDRLVERGDALLRLHIEAGAEPAAALLPFDELFEIRATAAIRVWRGLTGRNVGANPAALSAQRRDRLVLALRALDGRLDGAKHREIASAIFGVGEFSKRDWISHDLRDRTARTIRLGVTMMKDGYRRLLVHPFRRRL